MFSLFGFGRKKKCEELPEAVVYPRQEHCISRKNIDGCALKVLYRLSSHGYTAYLVGGAVRDLLLERAPKDFDVGTNAKPNEVRKIFNNCFVVGRRFRLAHVRFSGGKVIETATFRKNSMSVGDILKHAAEGPFEDNTFGTPATDAMRRDFTINGLFYDINTFSVIDYVGGMEDLRKKVVRSIGDPYVRFREDPVRMMRGIKFASRLDGFYIEKNTADAIKELHTCILNAAVPRVCEEVFRLFSFGSSKRAFKMLYDYQLMGDILPNLANFITKEGDAAKIWQYLAALDKMDEQEVTNVVRIAALYGAFAKKVGPREALKDLQVMLKCPKAVYFGAVQAVESVRRLSNMPSKGRRRIVYNRDFNEMLTYNRLIAMMNNDKNHLRALEEWTKMRREVEREQAEAEAERLRAEQEAEGTFSPLNTQNPNRRGTLKKFSENSEKNSVDSVVEKANTR